MTEKSKFEILAAVNVSNKLEKKNGLTYLSWAWAWDQFCRHDAEANYKFLPHENFSDGTVIIWCAVTAFGKTITAYLPVMDLKNHAIPLPTAVEINKTMQRCLTKGIAMHGLGLYVYAGEDLPEGEEKKSDVEDFVNTFKACANMDELRKSYGQLFAEAGKDKMALGLLTKAKDSRKKELLAAESTSRECTSDKFAELAREWEPLVRSGKKNSTDTINAINTRFELSQKQTLQVQAWEKEGN